MGTIGPTEEFRVKLASQHEGMVLQLGDFDQDVIRAHATETYTVSRKDFTIFVIKLKAMPMALQDLVRVVGLRGK